MHLVVGASRTEDTTRDEAELSVPDDRADASISSGARANHDPGVIAADSLAAAPGPNRGPALPWSSWCTLREQARQGCRGECGKTAPWDSNIESSKPRAWRSYRCSPSRLTSSSDRLRPRWRPSSRCMKGLGGRWRRCESRVATDGLPAAKIRTCAKRSKRIWRGSTGGADGVPVMVF